LITISRQSISADHVTFCYRNFFFFLRRKSTFDPPGQQKTILPLNRLVRSNPLHITAGIRYHVFRRDCLAGYQPAVLLLQAQVSETQRALIEFAARDRTKSHPMKYMHVLIPRYPGQLKARTSAAMNTMSAVSAIGSPARWPTPGTLPCGRIQRPAPCTCT
jgi:hypothetical protein